MKSVAYADRLSARAAVTVSLRPTASMPRLLVTTSFRRAEGSRVSKLGRHASFACGMGSRLAIQQTWGSLDVMCDRKARPSLLELESLRLTATIKADARGQFERRWVRNVVEEPLDEAGAQSRVELSE